MDRKDNLTGERLRGARKKKKMTMEYVAGILDISLSSLRRYETGEIKSVPKEKIEELAKLYEYPPSYFYDWIYFKQSNNALDIIFHILEFGITTKAEKNIESIPKFDYIFKFFETRNLDKIGIPMLTKEEENSFQTWKNVSFILLEIQKLIDEKYLYNLEKTLKAFYFLYLIEKSRKEKTSYEKINNM